MSEKKKKKKTTEQVGERARVVEIPRAVSSDHVVFQNSFGRPRKMRSGVERVRGGRRSGGTNRLRSAVAAGCHADIFLSFKFDIFAFLPKM